MVEDDRLFADIHVQKMRERGLSVTHVTNGNDAMRRLESENPDLILLDIGLPERDGFGVLEDIREHELGTDVPVVMLSRLSAKEDIDRAFQLGASEYMIKSQHTPDDVVDHIEKRLGLKPGFTLAEGLIVVGAIVLLAAIAFFQLNIRSEERLDNAEWQSVQESRSSLLAASQEGYELYCNAGGALRSCRLCRDENCTEDRTREFLREELFALRDGLLAEARLAPPCRSDSTERCDIAVLEATPIDPAEASLLFFLKRGRDGIPSGLHILRPNGAIE